MKDLSTIEADLGRKLRKETRQSTAHSGTAHHALTLLAPRSSTLRTPHPRTSAQIYSGAHGGTEKKPPANPYNPSSTRSPSGEAFGAYDDYSVYYPREVDRQDRDDRDKSFGGATGGTWRRTYVSEVGETPTLQGGDHEGARSYLTLIEGLIERGGWTKSENAGLHKLKRKWKLRAEGWDPVFEVMGNPQGEKGKGMTVEQRRDVRHMRMNISIRRAALGLCKLEDVGRNPKLIDKEWQKNGNQ